MSDDQSWSPKNDFQESGSSSYVDSNCTTPPIDKDEFVVLKEATIAHIISSIEDVKSEMCDFKEVLMSVDYKNEEIENSIKSFLKARNSQDNSYKIKVTIDIRHLFQIKIIIGCLTIAYFLYLIF